MDNTNPAIAAMAEKCRAIIEAGKSGPIELPESLRPQHILWMCDQIERHAENDDWPITKLHRWIGFVQSAMMATRMLDLGAAKAMFDSVKNEYRPTVEDQDLVDHLDPANSFELELGGQG